MAVPSALVPDKLSLNSPAAAALPLPASIWAFDPEERLFEVV
jgi:hypothetical protein